MERCLRGRHAGYSGIGVASQDGQKPPSLVDCEDALSSRRPAGSRIQRALVRGLAFVMGVQALVLVLYVLTWPFLHPVVNLAGEISSGQYCSRDMPEEVVVLPNSGLPVTRCFTSSFRSQYLIPSVFPYVSSPTPVKATYLGENPAVPRRIPVQLGRQLFVDSFLIDLKHSSDWERRTHQPSLQRVHYPNQHVEEYINPFAGGVIWDAEAEHLRMYYRCSDVCVCLRVSAHGTDAFVPYPVPGSDGSNVIHCTAASSLDAFSVMLDPLAKSRSERYKMAMFPITRGEMFTNPAGLQLWTSQDGLGFVFVGNTSNVEDRSTINVDPFRQRYIFSAKENLFFQRNAMFWDAGSWTAEAFRWNATMCGGHRLGALARSLRWSSKEVDRTAATNHIVRCLSLHGVERPVYWNTADTLDRFRPTQAVAGLAARILDRFRERHVNRLRSSDVYGTDVLAYESLMLGFNSLWLDRFTQPKDVRIFLSYSRDGIQYGRDPVRDTPFIDIVQDTDSTDTFSELFLAGSGVVVDADDTRLHLFVRAYHTGSAKSSLPAGSHRRLVALQMTLRRDGFVSLQPRPRIGTDSAVIVTKPLASPDQQHVFVNVACRDGRISVDVLDAASQDVILTYPALVHVDSTKRLLGDLPASARAGFRLRFQLHGDQCQLYSFWTSERLDGASGGFLGGGRIGDPVRARLYDALRDV